MQVVRIADTGTSRKVYAAPGVPSAASMKEAAARGRRESWSAARRLGRRPTGWKMEYFKVMLGRAEVDIGIAEMMVNAYIDNAPSIPELPATPGSLRATRVALSARGFVIQGQWYRELVDRMMFVGAVLTALLSVLTYVAARISRVPHSSRKGALLALHGEWSTRTRHVLDQLRNGDMSDLILLLGRTRFSPHKVRSMWREKLGHEVPKVACPVSLGALVQSLGNLPGLMRDGVLEVRSSPVRPTFREQVAIAFRVILGEASARWWSSSKLQADAVVFGHTGTADTTALERAMQASGAQTIHAVHGLATGPNFVGISDLALFRCGYDAKMYERLKTYGICSYNPAPRRKAGRGAEGVLLLTNLAHPMNPDYLKNGIESEAGVLRVVAEAAGLVGARAWPLLWKPHPTIASLPESDSQELRKYAESLGFQEVPNGSPVGATSAQVRWVLTTPSTACMDLLAFGVLALILDPQDTLQDASPSRFPSAELDAALIAAELQEMDNADVYESRFQRTMQEVGPADKLDLVPPINMEGPC